MQYPDALVVSRLYIVHEASAGGDEPRPVHGTSDDGSAATDGRCSMDGRRGWATGRYMPNR